MVVFHCYVRLPEGTDDFFHQHSLQLGHQEAEAPGQAVKGQGCVWTFFLGEVDVWSGFSLGEAIPKHV